MRGNAIFTVQFDVVHMVHTNHMVVCGAQRIRDWVYDFAGPNVLWAQRLDAL